MASGRIAVNSEALPGCRTDPAAVTPSGTRGLNVGDDYPAGRSGVAEDLLRVGVGAGRRRAVIDVRETSETGGG